MDASVTQNQADRSCFHELRDYRNMLVLAAAIITQVVCFGIHGSMGVLHETLLETFGELQSLTAAVTTTCHSLSYLAGALASLFCLRFNAGATIALGGALAVVGYLASFFATSISYLLVSDGVLTGVGSAFIRIGGIAACVNQFDKDRKIIVGICVAGGGLGKFLLQQFQYILLEAYGWRGSKLLFAGIALHTIIAAVVIQCFQKKQNINKNTSLPLKCFSFAFMRNWRFVVWMMYILISSLPYALPNFALLDYAIQMGFSYTSGLWMLSVYAIVSIPGRFIIGVFVHLLPHWSLMFMVAISATYGLLLLLFAFIQVEMHGFILSIAAGSCLGFLSGGKSLVTLEISGAELFAQYYGITTTINGISLLMSGPLFGWVTDITGGYNMAFVVAGSLSICACFILCTAEVKNVSCRCESTSSYNVQ